MTPEEQGKRIRAMHMVGYFTALVADGLSKLLQVAVLVALWWWLI